MTGRVLQAGGGTYRVRAGGRDLDCSLRGRIKLDEGGSVAVGDRVEIEELDDGSCRITDVLPRHSALTRRAVSRRKNQVMAANVDQVAIVVSVARPDPDFYMLDRLLAVAEADELDAFLVCNKTDLPDPIPEELRLYAGIGYDVLPISTKAEAGLEALRDRVTDRTTVLAGSSGVGKSSLLNALDPSLELRVGDVGDRSGRGRHTTTSARLIPLGGDTYIADTPGIQHFVPARLEPGELDCAFREFREFLGGCRFADCRHRTEPGCAVRAALDAGQLSARRHESYLALLDAAETAELEARTSGAGSGG